MRLLFSIVSFFCAVSVSAQDDIINVYGEEFAPYNYRDVDGTPLGVSTAQVHRILKQAGLKYTIKLMPWSRAVREAERDNFGLLYSTVRTQEREGVYDWLAALTQSDFHLFASSKDTRSVTLEAIRKGQFTASCAANDASCAMLKEMGFKEDQLTMIDGLGVSEALMILYGRADLYLGDLNHQPFRMKLLGLPAGSTKPVLKFGRDITFYLVAGFHVDEGIRARIKKAADALELAAKHKQKTVE